MSSQPQSTMSEKEFKLMMTQVFKFSNYGFAKEFTNRVHKIYMILHGDDGLYWVTTPRVAAQLVKAGYEYA